MHAFIAFCPRKEYLRNCNAWHRYRSIELRYLQRTLLIVFLFQLSFYPFDTALGEDDLFRVLQDWESRAAAIHSLRVSWEEVQKPGPALGDLIERRNHSNLKGSLNEKNSTALGTLDSTYELIVDENKIALKQNVENTRGGEKRKMNSIASYNGSESNSLTFAEEYKPQGIIDGGNFLPNAFLGTLRPLFFVITPLSSERIARSKQHFVYSESELVVTKRHAVIDGSHCIVLRSDRKRIGQRTQYLFVDPAKAHSIVRSELRSGEKIISSLDIEYDFIDGYFIPSSWEIANYSGASGDLTTNLEAKVTNCEINITIPSAEFDIEFPESCLVFDKRSGEIIQREGNIEKVVSTFETASSSTIAAPKKLNKIFLLINILLVVLLGVLFYFRRLRLVRSE